MSISACFRKTSSSLAGAHWRSHRPSDWRWSREAGRHSVDHGRTVQEIQVPSFYLDSTYLATVRNYMSFVYSLINHSMNQCTTLPICSDSRENRWNCGRSWRPVCWRWEMCCSFWLTSNIYQLLSFLSSSRFSMLIWTWTIFAPVICVVTWHH